MATIEVKVKINAPTEKVWVVVSDIDNEPKFWKGTKEVRNISKNENTIEREITIAFREQKCMQKVTLEPMKQIHAKFTKGIMKPRPLVVVRSNWAMPATGFGVLECWSNGATWQWLSVERESRVAGHSLLSKV